ncbi:hypothetical protein AAG570_003880 [Ranatra chinensis]|uniref:BZIP domain-containing protein n=1 Tax=Ranatra chinensis TaxID=642074 RepID=A0ABD0Y4F3_9HEMI
MKVGIGGKSTKAAERLEEARSSSEETGDEAESLYPRLRLTEEEKKLMMKEGVLLPTHYPLSKEEERELKRIRRKIRNKISAQDSRKRKKEYVDGLEDRVKQCSVENANLIKRVKALQSENQSLTAQLRRLQAVIAKGRGSQSQPATCLVVLVLSLALLMAPNMRQGRPVTRNDIGGVRDAKTTNTAGHSRSLLEIVKPSSVSEFVEPPLDGSLDGDEVEDKSALISNLAGLLRFRAQHHDHDYTQTLGGGRKRARSFVVPPIDDEDWPPPKVTIGEDDSFLDPLGGRNSTTRLVIGSPYRIIKAELSSDEGEPM